MTQHAAITGVGQIGYTGEMEERYVDLAEAAARRALDDADMAMDDLDAVVFSQAPEAFMGISHPERWAADNVGAAGKPSMRIHTGGSTGGTAAQAGYFHVASGRFDNVLVVGAEKIKENNSPQTVLNAIWDPVTEKDFGLNAINMTSFQAVRYMDKYGATREDFAKVAVRSRRNGARNPHAHVADADIEIEDVLEAPTVCWPLGLIDSCPSSAGGCAVVVSSEDTVEEQDLNPAWITGVGHRADSYYMGDRMGNSTDMGPADSDHAHYDYLGEAADQAYEMAGIEDPVEAFDVGELYAPFTSTEFAIVEALGLAEPEGGAIEANRAGRFDLDGEVPVNPSGGTLCANPIAVTALARVAEAALQIRGTAGAHQVPDVGGAVATGPGGSHQFHAVMTMSDTPTHN
jgi:acetyl-CoA C-acetyltransferase